MSHQPQPKIMKIRFIKNYQAYKKGQIADVSTKSGLSLVKKGLAIVDRMFDNYRIK